MGITRLLLRVFGDPNWPSENVSATSIVPRNMSTRFHRSARISPIRSPVSTATVTTVRQGSESSGRSFESQEACNTDARLFREYHGGGCHAPDSG